VTVEVAGAAIRDAEGRLLLAEILPRLS